MIKSSSRKGLRLLHEKDNASELPASQLGTVNLILGLPDAAAIPSDMDFSGYGFHKLADDLTE